MLRRKYKEKSIKTQKLSFLRTLYSKLLYLDRGGVFCVIHKYNSKNYTDSMYQNFNVQRENCQKMGKKISNQIKIKFLFLGKFHFPYKKNKVTSLFKIFASVVKKHGVLNNLKAASRDLIMSYVAVGASVSDGGRSVFALYLLLISLRYKLTPSHSPVTSWRNPSSVSVWVYLYAASMCVRSGDYSDVTGHFDLFLLWRKWVG